MMWKICAVTAGCAANYVFMFEKTAGNLNQRETEHLFQLPVTDRSSTGSVNLPNLVDFSLFDGFVGCEDTLKFDLPLKFDESKICACNSCCDDNFECNKEVSNYSYKMK